MQIVYRPQLNQAKNIYIGIDNGLSGAVVSINQDTTLTSYADTPTIDMKKGKGKKQEFVVREMRKCLVDIITNTSAEIWVILEAAQAMPKQGLSSTFTTGRGAGLWEGLVVGLDLKYDIIHPKTWTKTVLHDLPAGDPKRRSMIKSQRIFPNLPLTKPNGTVLSMDGRSDAALLAYYGWMMHHNYNDMHEIKRTPVRRKP